MDMKSARSRSPSAIPLIRTALLSLAAALFLGASGVTAAAQVDLPTPANSQKFGTRVVVLPNGNIVVTDPNWLSNAGAVYLYSADGVLISTLIGSSGDLIGFRGIVVLPNGNFLVVSPNWRSSRGAVTWVNGTTGLDATVGATNSLTGATANDSVGNGGITILSNGNYVVASPFAAVGGVASSGAVTWCDGSTGKTNDQVGVVLASNSLVGAAANSFVGSGGVTALNNGNFVVSSPVATVNGIAFAGAATWVSGTTGQTGTPGSNVVSTSNSLVGAIANDEVSVGGIVALTNGNYVVVSNLATISAHAGAGAATWVNGATGQTKNLAHTPSPANSLVGPAQDDGIGSAGAVALTNGNYVVASPAFNGGRGAATFGNGVAGTTGNVSASNSLAGAVPQDAVAQKVIALSNGNYVVTSPVASIGSSQTGAATWVNGTTGLTKNGVNVISTSNSLVGPAGSDLIGKGGAVPLSNGNYVVVSPDANIGAAQTGAVTWGDGAAGSSGLVSTANSLVGASTDNAGSCGVIALSNGNYVVDSCDASVGASQSGAVTWVNGANGHTSNDSNAIQAANSLVGAANDNVGLQPNNPGVVALANGNYVVLSPNAHVGGTARGAVTFGNGSIGYAGTVSAQNSLVGTLDNDRVGKVLTGTSTAAYADGSFSVTSAYWNGGNGAATLASGAFRPKGTLQSINSVLAAGGGGTGIFVAYDSNLHRMAVGRPQENIVTLFTPEQLFADGFDG